jgi:hypothetical protein
VLLSAATGSTAGLSPVGIWRIEKVAAYADSPQAGPEEERKYIGQVLSIEGGHAALGKDSGTLREAKRWDTQGKEWLDEFRTNPKDLKLPRYVRSHDLGFAQVIVYSPVRLLIDLGGTWFWAARRSTPAH